MHKYAIYTYELTRGKVTEGDFRDGPQVVTPGIEHAYENFERIFGERNNRMKLRYKPQKGAETSFPCYVRAHNLGVVLLRIDRLKNVYTYDIEWAGPIPDIKKKGHESYPKCHIVIDNREGCRQMAIEIEPAAWRDMREKVQLQQNMIFDMYGVPKKVKDGQLVNYGEEDDDEGDGNNG